MQIKYGGFFMSKNYETPVAVKLDFSYNAQAETSSLSCTQNWTNYNSSEIDTCSHTVVVKDSGY